MHGCSYLGEEAGHPVRNKAGHQAHQVVPGEEGRRRREMLPRLNRAGWGRKQHIKNLRKIMK